MSDLIYDGANNARPVLTRAQIARGQQGIVTITAVGDPGEGNDFPVELSADSENWAPALLPSGDPLVISAIGSWTLEVASNIRIRIGGEDSAAGFFIQVTGDR